MAGPFIRIDDRCATSMRNVWAIGDVTGEPMLAHRAMAQGEMVAEIIAGKRRAFDQRAIPAVCFTDPEIVAVGLSPEAARAAHGEIRRRPLSRSAANGRAMTRQDDEGFVRVVGARRQPRRARHPRRRRRRLGALVGVRASPSRWARGSRTWPGRSTPTRRESEAFHEAALKALGMPLHI